MRKVAASGMGSGTQFAKNDPLDVLDLVLGGGGGT